MVEETIPYRRLPGLTSGTLPEAGWNVEGIPRALEYYRHLSRPHPTQRTNSISTHERLPIQSTPRGWPQSTQVSNRILTSCQPYSVSSGQIT